MKSDSSYQVQRVDLLFILLKWLIDTQQVGASISDISGKAKLSEWETQHLFQEYLGKDPIRFVRDAFSPSLAQIKRTQLSVFDVIDEEVKERISPIDVDIQLIDQSPAEITYAVFPYFLGAVFIAAHEGGVCQVTFEDAENGLARLRKTYPKSGLREEKSLWHELTIQALMNFFLPKSDLPVIPICVKATPFQIQVWNELVQLQKSQLTTYGDIANQLGDPNASRAVGTAVGANPIALLIPCHRVVHQSGKIGAFRWGTWTKQVLLAIEK